MASKLFSTIFNNKRNFTKTNLEIFTRAYRAVKPVARNNLYSRISPLGDPDVSLTPVLDQWVLEGQKISELELQRVIRQLRSRKRFKHALQVSEWMSGQGLAFSVHDHAVQLDLIGKVRGLESAETYFNSLNDEDKVDKLYGALLNCYVREGLVDESLSLMQKMKEMGSFGSALNYNGIMCLYTNTGQHEKIPDVLLDMKENGVPPDNFSYRICINSYGARSELSSMENVLQEMESQSHISMDWGTYSTVANYYIIAGLKEKAIIYLKKCEDIVSKSKDALGYNHLISHYASLGNKDEMMKFWGLQKIKCKKQLNRDYITMLGSLVKIGELEEAEKMLEEWESSCYCYDFRVPNIILLGYSQKGMIEKADAVLKEIVKKGKTPTPNSWSIIAAGYADKNNMEKGELLLSAFFQVLFDRLASRDLLNFVRQLQGGLDSELKKWENTLIMIQAVLSDAEEKQLTDRAVKIWLDDLRDLAYDAEDILDEFATDALKQESMAENSNHSPACFNCFSPSSVKFNIDMDSKIKSITSRLDELCAKRIVLGLQLIPGGMSNAWKRRPPSSSVPTERVVYGRDEDKARILEMVLSDDPTTDANFCVIPIVGMAGAGKTTLAREVYNDRAVQNLKFDVKAWVCVSDDFDVLSISRALLESITSTTCDLKTLNEVQVKLKIAVDGKRFLLVLDDVWNENYNLWEILKAPFRAGAPNSKIIVTTRHSNVASTMGSVEHYSLKLLSDEDCWSVFVKHGFESKDAGAHQFSELFRKKIVAKCGGLPLAASTLGGLLRTRHTEDAWEDILSSKMWDLPQQTDILPVLRLSYHYLPSHLKRCFTYCATFPKDYEFEKNELVFLWMAEGMIQQSRTDKLLEDLGNEFFCDLLSRSLFQQSSRDVRKFVMHDLVHDLAQLASGDTSFRLEEVNKQLRTFERIRHFSYPCAWYEGKNKFYGLNKAPCLRTFLPLNVRGLPTGNYITNMVLLDLLPKLKKLRVLSLEGYCIAYIPNSIKDLKLLRYINFSRTLIESLPESISSLFNLQFLLLRTCHRLQKLPSNMRNLLNLHHLDIGGSSLITEMPSGMNRLKFLQTLSDFIVGRGIGSGLKDLKNLTFLCGKLCILRLENANDSWDAREASLGDKKGLEELSLGWGSPFHSRNEIAEEKVLDMLQPHTNIKKLEITRYSGRKFPIWLGDPSFSNMVTLKLIGCANCTSLPAVGKLVSLKELTIRRMLVLRSIGSEICGKDCSTPFQSLETLCFSDLPELEFWDTGNQTGYVEIFPRLVELYIEWCPKLSGKLPDHLPALETLAVSYCKELVVSFSSFPLLRKLEISRCKGVVCSSPIDSKLTKSITISNCSLDIYGCKGMVYNSPLHSKPLSTPVTISNILEFGKLLKQGLLPAEFLGIGDSQDIGFWRPWFQSINYGEEAVQGLRIITLPEEVSIEEKCMSLVSFTERKFFPINRLHVKIENSGALKSLLEGMMYNCAQLKCLNIEGCDSLEFIARGKLPSFLEGIEIHDCKKLQCLVVDEEDASAASSSLSSSSMALKRLVISGCSELTNLSSRSRQLSKELEFLNIEDCPKLESIAESFHGDGRVKRIFISNCGNLKFIPKGLQNLNCLEGVTIWNCPSLVSFPERGLPSTVTNVSIVSCEKFKALPEDLHKLNYLQRLAIWDCPSIVSFPEAGFPTNLTSLIIANIKMYKAIIQWGLHRLTSLLDLYINEGDNAESFPDERMGIILPASLTGLSISGFPNLKCLSAMGFQSLASLEFLRISNCPKLKSFPEVGLPSSLLRLQIEDCSWLKKQCKRDKGKDWSKIAHIPYVTIDGKFIFD